MAANLAELECMCISIEGDKDILDGSDLCRLPISHLLSFRVYRLAESHMMESMTARGKYLEAVVEQINEEMRKQRE